MVRWLLVLAACGSTAVEPDRPPPTPTPPTPSVPPTKSKPASDAMSERVKAWCGDKYNADTSSPHRRNEGCRWVPLGAGRGEVTVVSKDADVVEVDLTIETPAGDADAMRAKALDMVHDLFDDAQRASIARALERVYQKSAANLHSAGWVGHTYVHASTEIEVEHPEDRWIDLRVSSRRTSDSRHEPFDDAPPADEFATPLAVIADTWLAAARVECDKLVAATSALAHEPVVPAVWEVNDVSASCRHPNEHLVGQFVVTWAPTTHAVVYLRIAAGVTQKVFTDAIDKLAIPLVGAPRTAAVRTAASKPAPVGRTFHEAKDITLASHHEPAGAFGGEYHEVEIHVDAHYKP